VEEGDEGEEGEEDEEEAAGEGGSHGGMVVGRGELREGSGGYTVLRNK
jgi:hypothetical protein